MISRLVKRKVGLWRRLPAAVGLFLLVMIANAACVVFAESNKEGNMTKRTGASDSSSCDTGFDDQELRNRLTPEQYLVTKQGGTERPFSNPYWDNKHAGIYVDVISGEPLFSSLDKFDSGTGWPSFTKPLAKEAVEEVADRSHGVLRTEVRSKKGDAHLGHVFDDGPKPTGERYCINSAALRFVPLEDLEKEGYGQYRSLFNDGIQEAAALSRQTMTAIFAAGCFWGVEETFRKVPGVISTEVGYTGGTTKYPSYKEVCSDRTGHAESVRVQYDPSKVSYDELLEIFWNNHDPTQLNRQGPDVGSQYRSAIFYLTPEQEAVARQSKERQERSGRFSKPIMTEIAPAGDFYEAEDYHQQYLEKRGMAACNL